MQYPNIKFLTRLLWIHYILYFSPLLFSCILSVDLTVRLLSFSLWQLLKALLLKAKTPSRFLSVHCRVTRLGDRKSLKSKDPSKSFLLCHFQTICTVRTPQHKIHRLLDASPWDALRPIKKSLFESNVLQNHPLVENIPPHTVTACVHSLYVFFIWNVTHCMFPQNKKERILKASASTARYVCGHSPKSCKIVRLVLESSDCDTMNCRTPTTDVQHNHRVLL